MISWLDAAEIARLRLAAWPAFRQFSSRTNRPLP
jgi:hypothetical protein